MDLRRFRRRDAGDLVTVDLDAPIGAGGEARVFAVGGHLAAKIYHQPEPHRFAKLEVMIANPPEIPVGKNGHVMIAWPLDLLDDPETGAPVGFLMDRVEDVRPLIDFYNPKKRREVAPGFHSAYLLRAARNLAVSISALHARGYVIGDVNESNILAKETALVTLVDLDSIQVVDPDTGEVYRSRVGKVEFTAPEIQGLSYDADDRTEEQDRFALAVLLFHLLMEGAHPFVGTPTDLVENKPLGDRIREGLYPYHTGRDTGYAPRAVTPLIDSLHEEIQELFRRCFEDGHDDPDERPDAGLWAATIQRAEDRLRTCGRNSQHRFADHQDACPWCARAERLKGYDAFPPRTASQRRAPELEAATARRNLHSQQRRRHRRLSRLVAVAAPVAVVLAVLLYVWQDGASAAERDSGAHNGASAKVAAQAAPEPREPARADPVTSAPPPDVETPRATERETSEPETAPARPADKWTDAPANPRSGTLDDGVDPVQKGWLQPMPRFGGDVGKVAYALRGDLARATLHGVTSTEDAVWISTDAGLLRFTPGKGRWSLVTTKGDDRPFGALTGCSVGLVCAVGGDTGTTLRLSPRTNVWWEIAAPARSIAVEDDVLWLGTGHGVVRGRLYGGSGLAFGRAGGHLPSDDVAAVQRLGTTLWAARRGADGGVSRLDIPAARWQSYGPADGLTHASALDLAVDKNAVWVVHGDPGLSRLDLATGVWRSIRRAPSGDQQIELAGTCVAVERDLNVWIGGDALYWYGSKTGRANRIAQMPGRRVVDVEVAHDDVWALCTGANGNTIVRVLADRNSRRTVARREQRTREFHNRTRSARQLPSDAATRSAVERGVAWLLGHQERDGRFDSDGFVRHDRGARSGGRGGPANDVGVTALAVLALLADVSPRAPGGQKRGDAARRGAAWLVGQMQSGRLGAGNGRSFMYGQVLGTTALCEAYAAFGDGRTRAAAQAAVAYLQRLQTGGEGWRYPAENGSDTSVTAAVLEALTTAADTGLNVDTGRIAAAVHWLESVTDDTGRAGYDRRGGDPFRFPNEAERFPAAQSEATTAAAAYARFLAGQRPAHAPDLAAALQRIGRRAPKYEAGRVDLIEWYYTAHALVAAGGDDLPVRPADFARALADSQRKDGPGAGSWDPIGVWGRAGGRVYATAMGLLILQAPLRTDGRAFAPKLSADPRLQPVREAADRSPAALYQALARLGNRFQPEAWTDQAWLSRIRRDVNVTVAAADLAVREATRMGDPLAAGPRLAALAERFRGLAPGDRAAQRLQQLRATPEVARELDARQELGKLPPPGDGARRARALTDFLGRFAGTATARSVIEEVMGLNAHRGMPKRPAGARVLDDCKPKSIDYSIPLDTAGELLEFELAGGWYEDIDGESMRFVQPEDGAELDVRVHQGKRYLAVVKAVQGRVDRTQAQKPRKTDGVGERTLRLRGRKHAARTWTFRTRQEPVSEKRILVTAFGDVAVELELTWREGRSDWERIIKSLKVRTGAPQDKEFLVRTGGWLLQSSGLRRIRRHATHAPRQLVLDQTDRKGEVSGTWTLQAGPAAKGPLADVIAAAGEGTVALHDGKRGLHWVVHSITKAQQLRVRAWSRIPGELDLVWTYVGHPPEDDLLPLLLSGLKGRAPR